MILPHDSDLERYLGHTNLDYNTVDHDIDPPSDEIIEPYLLTGRRDKRICLFLIASMQPRPLQIAMLLLRNFCT